MFQLTDDVRRDRHPATSRIGFRWAGQQAPVHRDDLLAYLDPSMEQVEDPQSRR
jgi:hypothetical protein